MRLINLSHLLLKKKMAMLFCFIGRSDSVNVSKSYLRLRVTGLMPEFKESPISFSFGVLFFWGGCFWFGFFLNIFSTSFFDTDIQH